MVISFVSIFFILLSNAAILLFANKRSCYILQDCCTCGCSPESQFNGYDICERCDKKGLFCYKEHKPKYFKGICHTTGYSYTDIVAIWRSYDWESGKQSSYLYPIVGTQGVTGSGPETAGAAKEEEQEATREESEVGKETKVEAA